MGREAGPTISVSESVMYVTGTSEDLLSGTVGYCYNQSDTPDEFTFVEPTQTTSYTAPQFKITASGVWRFHAKDLAGNTDFKSTSSLTKYTYHCNYCNQDTNSIHYRCPTHKTKSGSYCLTSQSTCPFTSDCTTKMTVNGADQTTAYRNCAVCGTYLNGATVWCSRKVCASCSFDNMWYWCLSHARSQTLTCEGKISCTLKCTSTNYSVN